MPSDQDSQRARLIGLGEHSFQKSYYPELRKRLSELERFRALLDQATDSIFLVGHPEKIVEDCNEFAALRLGMSYKEIVGRDLTEILPSLTKCLSCLPEDDCVEKKSRAPQEMVICMLEGQDGESYPADITLVDRMIEGRRYTLVVARDITDRQRAEKALRKAEEKYRSIFERALEGIYQADLKGGLISVNPAMAAILGYSSAKEMLDTIHDIQDQLYLDPKERSDILKVLYHYGQIQSRESRMRRKDGKTIWVSISARLIRDKDGEPLFVEAFLTDISMRKKAQEELAALNRHLEGIIQARTADLAHKASELEIANQRLMELDAMKSALLSSVSHELRTPLTSVLGFTKLIERDFRKAFLPLVSDDEDMRIRSERITENLEIIRHESLRLTRMINDFLDLSKIEAGRIEWKDDTILLQDIVFNAVQTIRGHLDEKAGVSLDLDIHHDVPAVRVDPDRLSQVLINLLQNAVKFTVEGEIRLSVSINDDMAQVTVRDTGPGIPQHDLDKVFNKFHQVEWTDRDHPKPPGTGLGLTICKQIVEHYGGRIWVESTPGLGSAFHFTLPLTA